MKDKNKNNKNLKLRVQTIFNILNNDYNSLEIQNVWNFKSIDDFIISFEKNSINKNILNSKKYGNIAKRLTKKILECDISNYNIEENIYYSDQEILEEVKKDVKLYSLFKKLYYTILKNNFWKLQIPFISLKYELKLDKLKSDYDRFVYLYDFIFKKKSIFVKNYLKNKKVYLNFSNLEEIEKKELLKVFYKLAKKMRKKLQNKKIKNRKQIEKALDNANILFLQVS